MNMGIYGIFIIIIYLLFHFLFGAKFTGPTVGAIVCANTFVLAGKHPRNVFPIVIGYLLAGILAEFFFPYFCRDTGEVTRGLAGGRGETAA